MNEDQQMEFVAAATRAFLDNLTHTWGLPPATVLASAHATIITEIAVSYGGKMAADSARRAAERVESLPSYREAPIAAMAPQGQA